MKELVLALPTFAFTVSTRVALGIGVGLLISERIPLRRRRAIGSTLVGVGAATTIPILMSLRRSIRTSREPERMAFDQSERLIGATRFPRKGDDGF